MKSNINLSYLTQFFLELEMFQREVFRVQTIYVEQHFTKIMPFMRRCGKMLYSRAGHKLD
jgi:hypothetical protein